MTTTMLQIAHHDREPGATPNRQEKQFPSDAPSLLGSHSVTPTRNCFDNLDRLTTSPGDPPNRSVQTRFVQSVRNARAGLRNEVSLKCKRV